MTGPFRKILGGGSDPSAPKTPQQYQEELNDIQKKVALIDQYISSTVEPTLNIHDDTIAGLKQKTVSNDESSQQANVKVDVLGGSLDDKVNASVAEHLNTQFVDAADKWFSLKDISAKSDEWLNNKDLTPALTKHMDVPEGMVPVDVGEFLGVLDRVGKRISATPELGLVNPTLKTGTTVGSGAGGVGVTTPGIPSTLHTITAIKTIEDRLTKLTSTWYSTLVNLQHSWDTTFFPDLMSVNIWKQSWSDSADFWNKNQGGINSLLNGSSAVFDVRISKLIDNKLAVFNAQIAASTGMTGDAKQFVTDMTTGRAGLGGTKPRDQILSTIQFYYDNFKAGSLKDSIKPSTFGIIEEWQAGTSGVNILKSHAQDFWSSADISGGLQGGSLRDRLDDYFSLDTTIAGLKDKVNSHLESIPAWAKLKAAEDRLKDILPQGGALGTVRDKFKDMRDCVEKVRTGMITNHTSLTTLLSELKDRKGKWRRIINDNGWVKIFGPPGFVFAGKDILEEFGNSLDDMMEKIVLMLEKVNGTIKTMHDDLNCLKDQFDQTANTMDSKLKGTGGNIGG